MSNSVNFNSSSISLASLKKNARQQQIQTLTTQVKSNESKINKINKEIDTREKIIGISEEIIHASEEIIVAAERKKAICNEAMQNCQNIITACKESKEIIIESKEITKQIIANNDKMIAIYETLIARNNLQQANASTDNNKAPTKTQITFADIAYQKPKMLDMNIEKKVDNNVLEKKESSNPLGQLTINHQKRSYFFSIFREWIKSLF